MNVEQHGIKFTYMRGGTSKALFFREADIPNPGPLRDRVLKRVMGTPDPMQIDGMGGTHTHTSKLAIVETSMRTGADVDYTFVQVSIGDDAIVYDRNCGNISSAVGPYAIDEGLIKNVVKDGDGKRQAVRIYNTGTKKVLLSYVPVDVNTGKSVFVGDARIDGVPGTGAPILLDFRDSLGATMRKSLLPTTHAQDTLDLHGTSVQVTICDAGTLAIFIDAQDLGITGYEAAHALTHNAEFISRCRTLRGEGAKLLGLCNDPAKVDKECPGLPAVITVAPSQSDDTDIAARIVFMNRCHDSMAGTGAVCIAACASVTRSIANQCLRPGQMEKETLSIAHPMGQLSVTVSVDVPGGGTEIGPSDEAKFRTLAFVRTARRIMQGTVFVPEDVYH